ncbi:MAG: ankyrin repeat domain-containing protein [Saprospiraceae bacterium]|nr:ankyrin repeat domain-containing protein [Saprospiraceae bacterium]
MLKFFRHIRKKLLSGSKLSSYFLYAIGEIILVVIGILIALQVNTWNENKKKNKTEQAYLNGIVANIDEDIIELNSLLKTDTARFDAYTSILQPFNDNSINIYSIDFIKDIGIAQLTQGFDGNSIVFDDMKSSGKINFVRSDVLRFALLEYYNESNKISTSHKNNNATINQLKDLAFITNLDINSLVESFIFKDSWSAPLDNLDLSFFQKDKDEDAVKHFANRVSMMKGILQVKHNQSLYLQERSIRLRNLIQDYLDGKQIDFNTQLLTEEGFSAIINGNENDLDLLINTENIDICIEIENARPISYLSLSIENNSMSTVKYLVEAGADLELACFDKTPLMYAVKYGHLDMVEYLLNAGADIDKVSIENKTAMDYAINYDHPEIADYLKSYSSNNK